MRVNNPPDQVTMLSVPSVHGTVSVLGVGLTGRAVWRGHERVGVGALCHPHGHSLLCQCAA